MERKVALPQNDEILLKVPKGSHLSGTEVKNNVPFLVVQVEDNTELEERVVTVLEPDEANKNRKDLLYIGSVVLDDGARVFDVFEIVSL